MAGFYNRDTGESVQEGDVAVGIGVGRSGEKGQSMKSSALAAFAVSVAAMPSLAAATMVDVDPSAGGAGFSTAAALMICFGAVAASLRRARPTQAASSD